MRATQRHRAPTAAWICQKSRQATQLCRGSKRSKPTSKIKETCSRTPRTTKHAHAPTHLGPLGVTKRTQYVGRGLQHGTKLEIETGEQRTSKQNSQRASADTKTLMEICQAHPCIIAPNDKIPRAGEPTTHIRRSIYAETRSAT